MSLKEKFKAFSNDLGLDTKFEESMKDYTTFKTGGNAEILVSPRNIDELTNIVSFCNQNGVKPFILGKGSNILVKDEGIRGVVINFGKQFDDIKLLDETTIECLAGTSLIKLCKFALSNCLSGLEFAYGIPGSVGGGAYMNAGAYGGEFKDVLYRCDHLNSDATFGFFENESLKLSYRTSAYKDSDKIIVKAYFKLKKGDKEQIKEKMDSLMAKRIEKQPLNFPSAGSTFKRPEGYFAGKLIEDCGLKGAYVGDAQVSEKHCGFIINRGNASSADIIKLIALVQDYVLAKTGIFLETEVKII